MTLSRRFTPGHLLMLSINGMLGSAWLFAPLYAAKIAGAGSLVAWLIGGLATAVIALTFAELSTQFPMTGGTAQIPQISHGMLTSFMLSWIAWLSALTMAPIEVQAILQYASTYFTSLMQLKNGIPVLTFWGYGWASILMVTFCTLNIVSYKGLIRFNSLLFGFKVIVILLAVQAITRHSFHSENFAGLTSMLSSHQGWQAILSAVALGGVAFAFTGFKHGVELAGEAERLKIALPLAIVGSVLCCLLLYLGLQLAFIGALSPTAVSHGWAHLRFSGDIGPFAGLAAGLGLVWLVKILYVDAVVSPGGAGLIYVTSTARILYAMSKIGYVPRWLSQVNRAGFPIAAIIFNAALGMCLFLPLPGWQAMVSFLVSGMVISYAIGPIALLCLRQEFPHSVGNFRLPLSRYLCPLAFYFCNLLSYWTGWETIYKLSIAMLIGTSFFLYSWWRGKLKHDYLGLHSFYWLIPYFCGLSLISYLGVFGNGRHIIPFGWDFAVIAVFSGIILRLAIHCRRRYENHSLKTLLQETHFDGLASATSK